MTDLLNSAWLKELGTTALMFVCFYLMLQSNKTSIESLIKMYGETTNRMFVMYEKLFDTTMINSGLLQKILEQITNNKWCPVAKKYHEEAKID
ncbi:MAG: hypothetical protein DKM22_05635 [Candidatus Melainabacteria bacterium]|nr:MAG: hypothetical protein DKM22_05635 [Candidatus Melainabacteria bacterium]